MSEFEGPSNTDTGLIWCPDVKYRVFPGSHIKMPLGRMIRNDSIASFWSETMLIDPCLMHVSVLNSWRQKLKCCGRLWKTMIMTCMCNHFSCHFVCNGFHVPGRAIPHKLFFQSFPQRIDMIKRQEESWFCCCRVRCYMFFADAKGWDNACLSQRLTLIFFTVYWMPWYWATFRKNWSPGPILLWRDSVAAAYSMLRLVCFLICPQVSSNS